MVDKVSLGKDCNGLGKTGKLLTRGVEGNSVCGFNAEDDDGIDDGAAGNTEDDDDDCTTGSAGSFHSFITLSLDFRLVKFQFA